MVIIIIIIMTYIALKRAKCASSDNDYQDAWSGRLDKSAILRFSRMDAAFSKVSSESITSWRLRLKAQASRTDCFRIIGDQYYW
jgi:hypothetical protein